jgi:hypothetical protein
VGGRGDGATEGGMQLTLTLGWLLPLGSMSGARGCKSADTAGP